MAPRELGDLVSVDAHEIETFANALDEALGVHRPEDKRQRLLQLPQKYYDATTRQLAKRQARAKRHGHDDIDMDVDESDANRSAPEDPEIMRLTKEAETWDLFRRLLPLRYADEGADMEFIPAQSVHKSGGLLEEFLESDPLAKERRVVLQWLQNTASTGPDIDDLTNELLEKADRGKVTAHGWLYTRSSIKLRKNMTGWPHLLDRQTPSVESSLVNSDGAPLVTQLDPDATSRQGRKLERQDEYCERASWLGCFEHLRRGSSISTIRDWCSDRTELWKAISMSAMLPTNDEGIRSSDDDPTALALWRRMCFGLARQGGSDDYERAVYGVLSGDIKSVEKVARSWDDILFVHYNALLRTQLDTFLLGRCPPDAAANITQSFQSFDAVQFHGNATTVQQRLQTLEFQKEFVDQARDPYKALQTAFIGKSLEQHLSSQSRFLQEDSTDVVVPFGSAVAKGERQKMFDEKHYHGLRVVAHVFVLVTLLQQLERGKHEEGSLSEAYTIEGGILGAYADFLQRAQLLELMPLYCSILEADQCYQVLTRNLIHIEEGSERITLLKLMEKTGIQVNSFVIAQLSHWYGQLRGPLPMEQLRDSFRILEDAPVGSPVGKQIKADFFGEEEDAVEERDMHVIRSLQWLLHVDGTWPHVLQSGIKAYKMFFGNMHLNAARKLMNQVDFAAVTRAMGEIEMDGNWVEDLGSWQQQLEQDEIEGFTARQVDADARTFRELEALAKALDSLETVASMRELAAEMPATNRDFWGRVGDEIKTTKEYMKPLLGKWLWSGVETNDAELIAIRRVYLPETVLAYVSALHFAGTGLSRDHLLEAMELAAVVAAEESWLCRVFVESGRMRELVEAFAACSKSLAVSPGATESKGKKSSGKVMTAGAKKRKEMGWSRDIWSVRAKPVDG